MSIMRKNNLFTERMFCVLSILLLIVLGAFLLWNRKEEQTVMAQLKEEEVTEGTQADDAPDSGDGSQDTGDTSASGNADAKDPETEKPSDAQTTPQQPENAGEILLSFRGDSFIIDEEKDKGGYPAKVRQQLEENKITATVEDYTLDTAGSLSQMRLAGIPQEELDVYIEEHRANAGEAPLNITETKVRELTEEELARTDKKGIPVLCMGYYGGWGGNYQELCEQQQKILDTYDQKGKYLIIGLHPNGNTDGEGYDAAMKAVWGDHYLPLDGVIVHPASSDEGKQEMAAAIYGKLTELGYLGS